MGDSEDQLPLNKPTIKLVLEDITEKDEQDKRSAPSQFNDFKKQLHTFDEVP